jgi:hypothetical protein
MLPHEADDRKRRWNMERREGARRLKLLQNLIIN